MWKLDGANLIAMAWFRMQVAWIFCNVTETHHLKKTGTNLTSDSFIPQILLAQACKKLSTYSCKQQKTSIATKIYELLSLSVGLCSVFFRLQELFCKVANPSIKIVHGKKKINACEIYNDDVD
jgi:hypothetical protein